MAPALRRRVRRCLCFVGLIDRRREERRPAGHDLDDDELLDRRLVPKLDA